MKRICFFAILVLMISASLSLAADEGAEIFKTKCAACHGEAGQGKPAMKMPAVKGAPMTVDEMVEYLTKGVAGKRIPHNKPINGINAEQAKAVAEYVKSLK